MTFDELVRSFVCVNCFQPAESFELYCSALCVDEANWVRYARRCRRDGRDRDPAVAQAIRIKLAHILAGGYDYEGRRVPDDIRQAVVEREQGRCRDCGAVGEEIDHIAGSASVMENLQLLCDACHNKKTEATMIVITRSSHPEEWAKAQGLKRRARAVKPLQLCDSDEWNSLHKDLLKRRRKAGRTGGSSLLF